MKLPLTVVSSEQFTYTKKIFVAEVSDFNGLGEFALVKRIFDDACDVGFDMQSSRTGKMETFYLHRNMYSEGEIVGWVFKPVNRELREKGVEVHILND